MDWHYDLVILGNSLAAIKGAIHAAIQKRVGLVITGRTDLEFDILSQALNAIPPRLKPDEKGLWLQGEIQRLLVIYSLGALAQAGVDVIWGPGVWQKQVRTKKLELFINGDCLQAQQFIFVDRPIIIKYKDTEKSVLDILSDLTATAKTPQEKRELVIIPGQSLSELVWVQVCLELEIPVAWGGNFSQLLAQEDPLVLQWLMADLDQAGVTFLDLTQEALPPKSILLSTSALPLAKSGMGLDSLKIFSELNRIAVNPYLHSSQPQLWACGSWLGGYDIALITQAEVAYLLNQSRSRWQPKPMIYTAVPWGLVAPVPIGRIGWHQGAAQRVFQSKVITLPVQPEIGRGWGQLVLDQQQQLLGATLWGHSAITAVKTLGLAMAKQSFEAGLVAAGWQVAIHPRQVPNY